MDLEKIPKEMPKEFILIKHETEKKVGSLHVIEDRTQNPVMSAEVIKSSKVSFTNEGDRVLVNSNAGIKITCKGEEYAIIREQGNVFAIL